jgi:hypothetical protein
MRILVLIFILSSSLFCVCQENTNTNISVLVYQAEIPDSSSYEIKRNDSNLAVEEAVLLQINAHRKHDEHFLWIVKEGLEILIFSIASIK